MNKGLQCSMVFFLWLFSAPFYENNSFVNSKYIITMTNIGGMYILHRLENIIAPEPIPENPHVSFM